MNFDELNPNNWVMFAIKNYDNPNSVTYEDFENDNSDDGELKKNAKDKNKIKKNDENKDQTKEKNDEKEKTMKEYEKLSLVIREINNSKKELTETKTEIKKYHKELESVKIKADKSPELNI